MRYINKVFPIDAPCGPESISIHFVILRRTLITSKRSTKSCLTGATLFIVSTTVLLVKSHSTNARTSTYNRRDRDRPNCADFHPNDSRPFVIGFRFFFCSLFFFCLFVVPFMVNRWHASYVRYIQENKIEDATWNRVKQMVWLISPGGTCRKNERLVT